jgi:hypothetical protein
MMDAVYGRMNGPDKAEVKEHLWQRCQPEMTRSAFEKSYASVDRETAIICKLSAAGWGFFGGEELEKWKKKLIENHNRPAKIFTFDRVDGKSVFLVDIAGNEKSFDMKDAENPTWAYILNKFHEEYDVNIRIFDKEGREIEETSPIDLMNENAASEEKTKLLKELEEVLPQAENEELKPKLLAAEAKAQVFLLNQSQDREKETLAEERKTFELEKKEFENLKKKQMEWEALDIDTQKAILEGVETRCEVKKIAKSAGVSEELVQYGIRFFMA